jgi:hypothetical protein
VQCVSAVGMRLAVTILMVASPGPDLQLLSVVRWDPCESGRLHLREMGALEALRRSDYQKGSTGSSETLEFDFQDEAVCLRAVSDAGLT